MTYDCKYNIPIRKFTMILHSTEDRPTKHSMICEF